MLDEACVAVVVPAYDVEPWIAETVRGMPAFVDHILVVDDASRDRTARAAALVGDPRVEILRHEENRGVGAAIVTGYHRARALGAHVTAVMAGDGQMHPDDLEGVARPVVRGEADYVKGNRLAYPGAFRVMPVERLVGTSALAWLTKHAAGLEQLEDSQCGYTAISAAALDALGPQLDALWPRYGFPNDILGALAREGLRIGEAVVRPVYRGEASGLRFWHLATIGYLIGRIAWERVGRRRRALPAASSALSEPAP